MPRWFWFLFRGRPFSGSSRRWWAGVTEAVVAAALVLFGVLLLVAQIALTLLLATPEGLYFGSMGFYVARILIAIALITIGCFLIVRLIWQVGVSAERRGALASRAKELELIRELRNRREDLPTIPRDHFAPLPGQTLGFRLSPSPRNIWSLITSGLFSIVFLGLATVLTLLVITAFQPSAQLMAELEKQIGENQLGDIPERPWLAVGLLVPIALVSCLAIYQFVRQLLKLTGIGPTFIELCDYPLRPGHEYRVFFSQAGRVRLKLLDVMLTCVEEATYNQGTDIRTERVTVLERRLFRQRGVPLVQNQPFQTEFNIAIPTDSMHSFKSQNNRVQWQIIVIGQAKNWPRLKRKFAVTVYPPESRAESESRGANG